MAESGAWHCSAFKKSRAEGEGRMKARWRVQWLNFNPLVHKILMIRTKLILTPYLSSSLLSSDEWGESPQVKNLSVRVSQWSLNLRRKPCDHSFDKQILMHLLLAFWASTCSKMANNSVHSKLIFWTFSIRIHLFLHVPDVWDASHLETWQFET